MQTRPPTSCTPSAGDSGWKVQSATWVSWCLQVGAIAAVNELPQMRDDSSGCWILLDSGSDEHLCPESWVPCAKAWRLGRGPVLRDVQGNEIPNLGVRAVAFDVAGQPAKADFTVAKVNGPLLSAGRLARRGFKIQMARRANTSSTLACGCCWRCTGTACMYGLAARALVRVGRLAGRSAMCMFDR